jgi:hypothetical protein
MNMWKYVEIDLGYLGMILMGYSGERIWEA